MEKNNKKNSSLSKFIPFALIIWFIVSIAAMMYASRTNSSVCLIIIGHYFLVFGMIFIISSKGIGAKLFTSIFCIIGLAIMISGGIQLWGSEKLKVILEKYFPVLFTALFPCVGLGIIIAQFIKDRKLKIKCTETVSGECIKLNYKYSRSNNRVKKLYTPVYRFLFYGKEYIAIADDYRNFALPKIGEFRDILINPSNPEEIYENNKMSKIFVYIVGMVFLVTGLNVTYTAIISL